MARRISAEKIQSENKRARKALDRLADKNIKPSRREFDKEADKSLKVFHSLFKGKGDLDLTKVRLAASKKVGDSYAKAIGKQVENLLDTSAKDGLVSGISSVGKMMKSLTKKPTILDDPKEISRLTNEHLKSLKKQQRSNAKSTVSDLQQSLREKISNYERKSVGDLLGKIETELDDQWYRIERLLRTEAAFAMNEGQLVGVDLLDRDPKYKGKIYGRWSELVDDLTGRPFDHRVGNDSIALHGQLAKAGDLFYLPPWAKVKNYDRGGWHHPPNRPNDRAILTPWFKGMGIKGWLFDGKKKIFL